MEDGEYLRSVQTFLNEQAELGKKHYESAPEFETFEVDILEKRLQIQEKLFYFLINEKDIETIMREALFYNIRRGAGELIEDEMNTLENSQEYQEMEPNQRRNELRNCLDS